MGSARIEGANMMNASSTTIATAIKEGIMRCGFIFGMG
jgi:hypothetical protein